MTGTRDPRARPRQHRWPWRTNRNASHRRRTDKTPGPAASPRAPNPRRALSLPPDGYRRAPTGGHGRSRRDAAQEKMSLDGRSVDGGNGGGIPSLTIVGWRRLSRALKSPGNPKKATPEGSPTFFPALLTALALPEPARKTCPRAGHRFALSGRQPALPVEPKAGPIAPTPSGLPLDNQRSFRDDVRTILMS